MQGRKLTNIKDVKQWTILDIARGSGGGQYQFEQMGASSPIPLMQSCPDPQRSQGSIRNFSSQC